MMQAPALPAPHSIDNETSTKPVEKKPRSEDDVAKQVNLFAGILDESVKETSPLGMDAIGEESSGEQLVLSSELQDSTSIPSITPDSLSDLRTESVSLLQNHSLQVMEHSSHISKHDTLMSQSLQDFETNVPEDLGQQLTDQKASSSEIVDAVSSLQVEGTQTSIDDFNDIQHHMKGGDAQSPDLSLETSGETFQQDVDLSVQSVEATAGETLSSFSLSSVDIELMPQQTHRQQNLAAKASQQIATHVSAEMTAIASASTSNLEQTLTVRLDPPELGEVIVRLKKSEGGLLMRVTAIEETTQTLLQLNQSELMEAMGEQSGDVTLEFSNDSDANDSPDFNEQAEAIRRTLLNLPINTDGKLPTPLSSDTHTNIYDFIA